MKNKRWILKPGQESFEIVDGAMAGRKFIAGKVYTEIPEAEKARFAAWAPVVPEKKAEDKK